MQITMADAATMALRFPYSPDAVQKIKAVLPRRTFDKVLKCWLVPVADFELVMAAYPELQAAPEVWAAAYPCTAKVDAETRQWCQSLATSGVRFVIVGKDWVRVEHDFAPAADLAKLQEHVDQRAASIARLLAAGERFDQRFERSAAMPTAPAGGGQATPEPLGGGFIGPMPAATSLERAFVAGIKNAAIAAQRKQAMLERQRRQRFEVKQQQATMFGGGDE